MSILKMYVNQKPYSKKELNAKRKPFRLNIQHVMDQALVKKLVAPYIKPTNKKLTPK